MMLSDINLPVILAAALMNSASPGPANLTIAGTAMHDGRRPALALAAGVLTGSISWSIMAALGFSALMLTHAWLATAMRYAAAFYLLYLAVKSARSAVAGAKAQMMIGPQMSLRRAYLKGLALHLTNPKPILFFGALFAIGVPPGTPSETLTLVIASIGAMNFWVFLGYALAFSSPVAVRGYLRLKRWIEAAFALMFGAAAIKILTARL